jgi:predicted small metal-binding protein
MPCLELDGRIRDPARYHQWIAKVHRIRYKGTQPRREQLTYSFACSQIVPGCDGVVSGETVDDVMASVAEHAADAHGITEIDDEFVEKVKAGISTD